MGGSANIRVAVGCYVRDSPCRYPVKTTTNINPTKEPRTSDKGPVRLSEILTGYLIAFVLGVVAVALGTLFLGGPEARASAGMNAFGDLLLFLAVFAVTSIPSTLGALFALKPYRVFWLGLAAIAIMIAPTSGAAFVAWNADPQSTAAELGFLRILASPFSVVGCALAGAIAPNTGPRIALYTAGAIEALMFLAWMFLCIFRNT